MLRRRADDIVADGGGGVRIGGGPSDAIVLPARTRRPQNILSADRCYSSLAQHQKLPLFLRRSLVLPIQVLSNILYMR